MHNIFFTADTHFGHGNIIRYTNRPFVSKDGSPVVTWMNERIIQKFNEVLRPGDILYHLGDVSWSSYDKKGGFLDRLNTKEVHLIWGNHDKEGAFKGLPFRSFSDIKSITIDKQQVILCHYPMRTWKNKTHGSYQLYGHVHGTMPGEGRQMDVGVDTNNFYPYSWDEVHKRLKDIPFHYTDKDNK